MRPEKARIRRGAPDDVHMLAEIEQSAAINPWTLSQIVGSSLQEHEHSLVLEQTTTGDLLGFAIYQQVLDEATLMNIALRPAWQGRGLGCMLLQAVLQALEEAGVRRCLLEVRESNAPAIALYHKHGFVDDARRSDYYPTANGREDALLMSRKVVENG